MKNKEIITSDMIADAVRDAAKEAFGRFTKNNSKLDEAYVAQPKQFKNTTEFVGQRTKELHSKLYQDYIKDMNKTSAELDTADKSAASANHSVFKSLKHDETFLLNAVWLHELFFSNCFDPQSELTMDSKAYIKIQRDFGTFDDWQRDFIGCALSAGEGWAVLGYNVFLKRYINTVIKDHSTDVMLGFVPIFVLDVWSHAYVRDYAGDKQSYIVAMMKEINWHVVEERLEKTETLAQVYR